jgi:hypothetical protein
MTNVSVSYVYPVNPDRAWEVVGKPGGLAGWHPAIASSPSDGKTRKCTLADGGEVVETILEHDDIRRAYRYAIDSSPLPIRDYVSTMSVVADGAGCKVTWASEFEVVDAPVADIEAAIRGLYEAGLTNLRAVLDARP